MRIQKMHILFIGLSLMMPVRSALQNKSLMSGAQKRLLAVLINILAYSALCQHAHIPYCAQ